MVLDPVWHVGRAGSIFALVGVGIGAPETNQRIAVGTLVVRDAPVALDCVALSAVVPCLLSVARIAANKVVVAEVVRLVADIVTIVVLAIDGRILRW